MNQFRIYWDNFYTIKINYSIIRNSHTVRIHSFHHNLFIIINIITFRKDNFQKYKLASFISYSMSESQFQHLTDEPPVVLLKKQIEQKTNEITLLKQQISQKDKTINENCMIRMYYDKSTEEKQQTIKQLTVKTFRLSQKLIEHQQTIQGQKNQLQSKQQLQNQLLQTQVQEKQQLTTLIGQLSEQLKSEHQARLRVEEELIKLQKEKTLIEEWANEEKETLMRECQRLEKQNEQLKVGRVSLESGKSVLMEQNQNMGKIIEFGEKRIQEQKAQNQVLKKQLDMLKAQSQQIKFQNKLIYQEKNQLQQRNLQLSKQAQNLLSQIQSMSTQLKQNQSITTQLKQKSIQLNTYETQLQQSKSQISYLQSHFNTINQNHKNQSTKYQQTLQLLQHSHNQLLQQSHNQNKHLKVQLKDKQDELIAIHIIVKELESRLTFNNIKPEYSINKSVLEKLKQRNSKLQEDIKDFEDILETLSAEKESYRNQNTQLRRQIEFFKNRLQPIKNQSQPINQNVHEFQQKDPIKQHELSDPKIHPISQAEDQRSKLLQEQNKTLHILLSQFQTEKQQKSEQLKTQSQNYEKKIFELLQENEQQTQKLMDQSQHIDQLQKINFNLNLQVQELKQTVQSKQTQLKQQTEYFNEVMNELPNNNIFSIEQIYSHLQTISEEIHQNASLLQGTYEQKAKQQQQSKTAIIQNIKNILFNKIQLSNKQIIQNKDQVNPYGMNCQKEYFYFNQPQIFTNQQANSIRLHDGFQKSNKSNNFSLCNKIAKSLNNRLNHFK